MQDTRHPLLNLFILMHFLPLLTNDIEYVYAIALGNEAPNITD